MPKQKKKFIPLPYAKQLGKDISKYPFVEIRWVDIEGDDGGWSTLSSLDKEAGNYLLQYLKVIY